jgi:hypothetical protein
LYAKRLLGRVAPKVTFAASSIPGSPVRETKLVKTPFHGKFTYFIEWTLWALGDYGLKSTIVEPKSPKHRGLRQTYAIDFPLLLTQRTALSEGKPVPHPAKRALPPIHRLVSVEVQDNKRAYT